MDHSPWRFAYASAIGASHVRESLPCQDFAACEHVQSPAGDQTLIAAVADGAGSATHSHAGARLACTSFLDFGRAVGEQMREQDTKQWLRNLRAQIEELADALGCLPRDLRCTFLGALIGRHYSCFVQVGDGVIVIAPAEEPEEYQWMFWPEQGEYANTTFFATDEDAPQHLRFASLPSQGVCLAMMSDGLQGLALNYRSRTVHNPFFQTMFRAVVADPRSGHLANLSAALADYLVSEQVNIRTDDDKTLILATRRRVIGER